MTGLRERRHRETRRALVASAFRLFEERDFAEVTMEDIAQAAGVSRSTAYRRFPTKDDVVLEVPRRWIETFDTTVAGFPDDIALAAAVRAACIAVARHIDSESEIVLAAYQVMDRSPGLQTTGLATRTWLGRIALMVERFGPGNVGDDTTATLAGAYLGALDAMMQRWADAGGAFSVVSATEALVDRLEPILPDHG